MIAPAVSNQSLLAFNTLWLSVYRDELNWLPQTENVSIFEDAYHDSATYFMAYNSGNPIGGVRLVHHSEKGFPVEKFADISGLLTRLDRPVIECQRLFIRSDFRKTRSKVFPFGIWPAFMKAILQHCMRRAIGYMLADCFVETPTTPIKSLLQIGFRETDIFFEDTELNPLGPSTLLSLDVRDMMQFIYGGRSRFQQYLGQHDLAIAHLTEIPSRLNTDNTRSMML